MLGAEGKGLRQLTRETCSVVARLDMPGEIKSLNVSNAAALSLYVGGQPARIDEAVGRLTTKFENNPMHSSRAPRGYVWGGAC